MSYTVQSREGGGGEKGVRPVGEGGMCVNVASRLSSLQVNDVFVEGSPKLEEAAGGRAFLPHRRVRIRTGGEVAPLGTAFKSAWNEPARKRETSLGWGRDPQGHLGQHFSNWARGRLLVGPAGAPMKNCDGFPGQVTRCFEPGGRSMSRGAARCPVKS